MKIQRILFPTDFSELSQAAEKCACDLADEFDAELHVLHVLHNLWLTMPQTAAALLIPPETLVDVIIHAEKEIQNSPPPAWAPGKKVVRAVRTGSTYDTIVQYAKENSIDLIVIGTHGRTGLPHVLLGSVAERVVQYAPCSVLTVRPDRPTKSKQSALAPPALKTA